jgi:Trk-type K+ transport system membrane component
VTASFFANDFQVAFQTSIFTLIVMGLLILAGNTAYPIFLRLTIWTMERLLPNEDANRDQRVALQFLLDHPRRCYTTLFPRYQTYWLVAALVALNGLDWIMFEILNIGKFTTVKYKVTSW